jgi:hypothetical protein
MSVPKIFDTARSSLPGPTAEEKIRNVNPTFVGALFESSQLVVCELALHNDETLLSSKKHNL